MAVNLTATTKLDWLDALASPEYLARAGWAMVFSWRIFEACSFLRCLKNDLKSEKNISILEEDAQNKVAKIHSEWFSYANLQNLNP